jgi:hypothetical protein
MTLAEVLPDEDYRFSLRFGRGTFGDFFRPTAQHDKLLNQRRHWLKTDAPTYAALLPDGIPLLEETIELGRAEQTLPEEFRSPAASEDPWACFLDLGAAWEPDFLLLKPDAAGRMILAGGCVCFPSSWSLAEKIGHPMEMIHGVVPGLNAAIGNQIEGFLKKLRPGVAWLRANWGLSRSAELNQHPERKLPRLDATVGMDEIWVRVERQMLTALPKTQGVLFAIRIVMHPLAEIQRDRQLAPRLARALETMPGPMAEYKGLASARAAIVSFLRAS